MTTGEAALDPRDRPTGGDTHTQQVRVIFGALLLVLLLASLDRSSRPRCRRSLAI